jgi:hypothetical protein
MKLTNTRRTIRAEALAVKLERGSDRFDTELPVDIDGVQGLTCNISATGIYFETDAAYEPGSRVHFIIEMVVQGQKKKLVCDGEVVRVDHKGSTVGIAARLVESFFADAENVNISPN